MKINSKVKCTALTAKRLDAEYYKEIFVINSLKISSFHDKTNLEKIREKNSPIRRGVDMPQFVDDEKSPIMISIGAFDDPGINFSGLKRISLAQHNSFSGSHTKPGDLLVAMGGYAGKAAICPPDTPESNIGRHTARIVIDANKANIYYIWSFLVSRIGKLQLERFITGSVQAGINLEDLREIEIPKPVVLAQKYIGDKVRQAELLREWAKQLEQQTQSYFERLSANPPAPKNYWRISGKLIEPYRINPKHYDPVVLELLKRAKENGVILQPISSLLGKRGISGGATPKGAQYVESGILFARVQNIKSLRLDMNDAVFIDSATDKELARSRCQEDDVILTITGYPGTASLVTREDLPVNINQHSVRFDVAKEVSAAYICAALNSQFLKYQVDRLAIGGTRDALDYPSVNGLLIPRLGMETEAKIDGLVRNYIDAQKLAQSAITAAKLLVESLIENQITEAQLIAAQQALDSGDTRPDQALLRRLKTDGLDGDGPPLFADLDRLYTLLDQAQTPDPETP